MKILLHEAGAQQSDKGERGAASLWSSVGGVGRVELHLNRGHLNPFLNITVTFSPDFSYLLARKMLVSVMKWQVIANS